MVWVAGAGPASPLIEEESNVTALALDAVVRWRPAIGRPSGLVAFVSGALLILIGVELAVLVTVLPETLEKWWQADQTGDFGNFYNDAANLDINGLYSPGLSVLMYPLTWLNIHNAYRVYVTLGMLAVLAVAYLAQRNIGSIEGRAAMALGIISLPQMHWALRLGHMTSMLALAALGGFLLLKRHPVLAGLSFALLVLKPQYVVIPGLYLLWTRNSRALAAMIGGVLVIEIVGFAAVGFSNVGPYIGSLFDLGADARDNLLPYQQSWQYAWQGFLISAHIEPNPLVVLDLSLLSIGLVVLVWARTTRTVMLAAAALGMMVVTPYANFYDWGILAVAGALLLRADIRWKALTPVILVGLYVAMLVSQHATPFPAIDVQVGVIEADGRISILPASYVFPTDGIYWITPLTLGVIGFLALAGKRRERSADERDVVAVESAEARQEPANRAIGSLRPAALLLLAIAVIPASYFVSAYVGHAPPFTQVYDPFSPSEVLKVIPSDFPLPEDSKLKAAGEGEGPLPYHVEWTSEEPVAAIAPLYEELLLTEPWDLMLAESTEPSYKIRLGRFTPFGFMTHWAMLDVSPRNEGGTLITLDLFVTQLLTISGAVEADPE